MEATRPGAYLEDQHHRIDDGIKPVMGGAGDWAALTKSLDLLRLHLYLEEAILFPVLEKAGLMMPVFVMKREHGQMWPTLAKLTAACQAQGSLDAVRADCEELYKLLRIHNPKEEQIVYTAADALGAKGADEHMVATLDAADAPDGWVCAMAPH
jgi:iron-sulfur cluster repair protein YtfE (RIC family)